MADCMNMRAPLTLFAAIILSLGGQMSWATPQTDARFISERDFELEWRAIAERTLKEAFVRVYFEPIAGQGVHIASEEQFIELIPDEDIEPYFDRIVLKQAEVYASVLNEQQLAAIAGVMAIDDDVTSAEVIDAAYKKKFEVAFEQASAGASRLGSDDPNIAALEDVVLLLEVFSSTLEDDSTAELMVQPIALGLGSLFTIMGYAGEIERMEKDLYNPVTLAAVEANDILRFANRIQKQTLIRQLSEQGREGGIQFIRPPQNR